MLVKALACESSLSMMSPDTWTSSSVRWPRRWTPRSWSANSVEAAVRALHDITFDLVVTDIFIPLGSKPRDAMGPRSRRYEETVQHLGGLVLLDELDRVTPRPKVLAHTACTDMALIEILGDCVSAGAQARTRRRPPAGCPRGAGPPAPG